MFKTRFLSVLRQAYTATHPLTNRLHFGRQKNATAKFRYFKPFSLGALIVLCEEFPKENDFNTETLEHDYLIRQATTVNVNAATQLLTVTLVAMHDTSNSLKEALSREISLVRQALEWGDEGTPPQHWDQLVEIRGLLCDLKYNLRILCSYMDYAEKLATTAAEISYLTGNVAASDAICERIDQACRSFKAEKQVIHRLQQESLELQKKAIVSSPQIEEKLKCCDDKCDEKLSKM